MALTPHVSCSQLVSVSIGAGISTVAACCQAHGRNAGTTWSVKLVRRSRAVSAPACHCAGILLDSAPHAAVPGSLTDFCAGIVPHASAQFRQVQPVSLITVQALHRMLLCSTAAASLACQCAGSPWEVLLLNLQCTSGVTLLLPSSCEAAASCKVVSQSVSPTTVQAIPCRPACSNLSSPSVTLLPRVQGLSEGRRYWARQALQLVRARLAAGTMAQLKAQPALAEEQLELGSLAIVSSVLGGVPLQSIVWGGAWL